MKIKCQIYYFPCAHLNQIYEGFNRLKKEGIIEAKYIKSKGLSSKPILNVIVNDMKVTYDTLDGFNWTEGSKRENLDHFRNQTDSNFYFKRSYSPILQDFKPDKTKVFPLGLNYNLTPSILKTLPLRQRLKESISYIPFLNKFRPKVSFLSKDFQNLPIPSNNSKVLFMTRLWNPEDAQSYQERAKWEDLNGVRIECIRKCREHYGDTFLGGLQDSEFSRSTASELILPKHITRKENYINLVKEFNICIASTGLHDSIGWKFGEYVSLSRAIVSEPLNYELPGNLVEGKNYFSFNDSYELIENVDILLSDRKQMIEMMIENYNYNLLYLKPESLVLRSLLTVLRESGISDDY